MKLYTEEQIDLAFLKGHSLGGLGVNFTLEIVEDMRKELTPIEILSDEEIKKIAIERFPVSIEDFGCEKIDGNEYFRSIFIQGIECLRDKIEGCSK